jgi:hypothetical protein
MPRRRNQKPEPIRIDELLNSPSMRGLVSFLEVRPLETTPVKTTPVITNPDVITPVETTRVELTGVEINPGKTTPLDATPVKTTPDITTPVVLRSRPVNVHRCVLAQDGHSRSEELLYQILWKNGQSTENQDCRLVQIPQGDLAEAMRMTTKNLRQALARLEEKLSIEQASWFDRGSRTARSWRVYSYKAILQRREQGGLTHVVRTKGVQFVNPETTPVKTTRVVMPDIQETTPVITTLSTRVDMTTTTGVVMTPPSLVREFPFREGDRETTTTEPINPAARHLATQLASWIGIDDEAVQMIWSKCREADPNCTPEEVAYMAELKKPLLQNREHGFRNPVGLLINSVPKFFANGGGEALKHHRSEEKRRREEAERGEQERLELLRRILADPHAAEEDKEWARQALNLISDGVGK